MDQGVREQVREWLEQGVVDLFLAYRTIDGHPLPHAFTRQGIEEVDALAVGTARYPLGKLAWQISMLHPEISVGLLVRDCDQRALNVLSVWNQIQPGKVKAIHLTCCPSALAQHADCSHLEPKACGRGKRERGMEWGAKPADVEAMESGERFQRWMYEFQKCIKCYGCRNICPVCFCKECSLEHPDLIGTGRLPPEIPLFHLVRAVHMAGRCIDCGLCEEACPAEIPLRLLYRKANEIVKDLFGYETGTTGAPSPFQVLGEQMTLEPRSI